MKILITGGAGFIGSHLCLRLVQRGHTVTVVDNLSPQIHGPEQDSPLYRSIKHLVKFVKGDVRSQQLMKELIPGHDAIVHLAAETGTGQSMYRIKEYYDVNTSGTATLLDVLVNQPHQIKKLLLASSRAVYGEGKYMCQEHGVVFPLGRAEKDLQAKIFTINCPICHQPVESVPTDETSPINPGSIYAATKHAQEQMINLIGMILPLNTIVLRLQNVYGPGQSLSNPYTGLLSVFSTNIRNNHDINIFEDGKESRDFVYIDDVVDVFEKSLEESYRQNVLMNVGFGHATSILRVAELLVDKFQSKVRTIITGNFRLGDIRHNHADIKILQHALNYTPSTSIEDGLGRFVTWVKTQPVRTDRYSESIKEMKDRGLYK